jgi:hypothetical protein
LWWANQRCPSQKEKKKTKTWGLPPTNWYKVHLMHILPTYKPYTYMPLPTD